jgi:hypothetical protein
MSNRSQPPERSRSMSGIFDGAHSLIEDNIRLYDLRMADILEKINLPTLIQNKNPYFWKEKKSQLAADLIKSALDAYLTAYEDMFFTDILKRLAIWVCERSYQGKASSINGVDFEFTQSATRYFVSVMAPADLENQAHIAQIEENLNQALHTLQPENNVQHNQLVFGCCYGFQNSQRHGKYWVCCGQDFWTLISGDELLFTELIDLFGHRLNESETQYRRKYAQHLNMLTKEFLDHFSHGGVIDWEKLVRFNSASARFPRTE